MLTDEQLEFFRTKGYLIAKKIIGESFIFDLQEDIEYVIDAQAKTLQADGKIENLYENLDFLHRATQLHMESPEILSPLTLYAGKGIFRLIACPDLLDVVEQLLGPEIVASGVFRMRPKLPHRPEGIVPWHQDSGYFDLCGDNHLIVTAWIPLMNATVETGCMEVLPQSHHHGVLRHYWAETSAPSLSVHPEHLPGNDPVPVPADVGDVVLMTNLTCHRSTDNVSDLIRWATDIRYNAPEAGDYYPWEAEFVARSPSHPENVVSDPEAFERLRMEHKRPTGFARKRPWLKQNEETFIEPPPVWETSTDKLETS